MKCHEQDTSSDIFKGTPTDCVSCHGEPAYHARLFGAKCAALHWAGRIGQSKVYDAQYLALAESLSAEFWTADQRLFHTLQGSGVSWVSSFL